MRPITMRARALLVWLVPASVALSVVLGPGCGNGSPPTPPPAFDRPEDVAFFCWDLNASAPVALERCAPTDTDGLPVAGLALHGLVTQTTTGELAAVKITGTTDDPAGVIDTDVRIPGFTFAAVGEVPSAVVVDPFEPRQAYVTSRGSSELHSVSIPSLRDPMRDGADVVRVAGVPAASRPSAMVLASGSLFIALPELGQIARLPLDASGIPDSAGIQLLDLSVDVPGQVDLLALDPASIPPPYLYSCPANLVSDRPPLVAPRAPVARGLTPEPWSLVVDAEDPTTPILLVGDRALPIIHRIDATSFTELDALSVGVPVRDLALTPRVPPTDGSTDASERYLYAIDETDRSVLVVDYTEANATFGAVLSASVVEPFDRLEVPFVARDVEVVTPGYDPNAISACVDADGGTNASPTHLRGVFLTVAMTDGRVRFFDVFDEDTRCRGQMTCGATGVNLAAADTFVAIERHRPRLGVTFDASVVVDPAPSWATTAGSATVSTDGTNNAQGAAPVLEELACPAPLRSIFPASGAARLCAVADPFAAVNQTWTISYEGVLPQTQTTGINFTAPSGGTMTIETRLDACARGVLGQAEAPTDGYLADYPGDTLLITSDLPPTILDDESPTGESRRARCERFLERSTGGQITSLRLPILSAATDPTDDPLADSLTSRLVLGPPLDSDATLDDVLECYPELAEGEIRARGVFVVTSAIRPGFAHPIVRDADGRCVVDQALAAAGQLGRAFYETPYVSSSLAFSLGSAPLLGGTQDLSFTVNEVPSVLDINVSRISGTDQPSLLTRLVYNDVDERLYAVDEAVQGLLRIYLTDVRIQTTFR